MQRHKYVRVSLQPGFEAPTMKALLWILGQHHSHPQADPGGTACDQHYFLPGTCHDNPAGSHSIGHLTAKLRDNKRIRKALSHGSHGLPDYQTGPLCSLILTYLIIGHKCMGLLKPPSKHNFFLTTFV